MKESIEERRNIPLTENKLKKRAFFKPESQSCFKPDCDIRTQIGNNCKLCGRETGIVMKIDTVIGEIHMYFLQKLSIFLHVLFMRVKIVYSHT